MNQIKKILYYLFIIWLVMPFTGCEKYFREGPTFSLSTKKERILGKWEVVSITFDDHDSTDVFKQRIGTNIEFTGLEDAYGKVSITGNNLSIVINGTTYYYKVKSKDSEWLAPKISISIDIKSSIPAFTPLGPLRVHFTYNWTISRLTNKEMWLETTNYNFQLGSNEEFVVLKLKK